MSKKTAIQQLDDLSNDDRSRTIKLALGRIFAIASRPYQAGDEDDYERARAVILELLPDSPFVDNRPNWSKHRHAALMRGDS